MLKTKYWKWYTLLIEHRRNYPPDPSLTYVERHHIIPRCLGGSNAQHNLVTLSAREHYVAHLLLTKMYDGDDRRKMCYAFMNMRRATGGMNRYVPTSRLYSLRVAAMDRSVSNSTRLKMSVAQRKRPPISDETRKLLSESVRASYTESLRRLRSDHFRSLPMTIQRRANMSSGQKGKKMSASFIDYCKSRKGELNPRSKTWTIVSPSGETIVSADISSVCLKHGLNYSSLRNKARANDKTPITRGICAGWRVLSSVKK